jgi:DNA-binding IscR family transcriptional regulator
MRVLAGVSGRVKAPALAEAVQSTSGFLSQVMNPLVRQGWVTSDPGPADGYSLAVDLGSVSVLAVIEAIEGPTDSEADTHLHVHKENNLLFPMVLDIERSFTAR